MTQQYTYQVKGINSDSDTCEHCGKTELSKVVWIVEIDQDGNETSEPVAYGTTCAAHKIGFNGTKAQSEKKVIESQAEYKKEVRKNYFENNCIVVDTKNGKVMIDRKFRIGQIMQEKNIDRNEAIAWIRNQMNNQWFMV